MEHEFEHDFDQDGRALFEDTTVRKTGSNHILSNGRAEPLPDTESGCVNFGDVTIPASNVQTAGGTTLQQIADAIGRLRSRN